MPKRTGFSTVKPYFFVALIFVVVTAALTNIALRFIEQNELDEYGKSLQAVLDSNLEALQLWSNQQAYMLEQIANNKSLLSINDSTFNTDNSISAPTADKILQDMQRLQVIKNAKGYILLSTKGEFILSSIDVGLTTGDFTPISEQYDKLINRANQQTVFIPPTRFGSASSQSNIFLTVLTPIIKDGKTAGLLGSFYSPNTEISDIASLGRIGESGETYMFDKNGQMVTRSRFEPALQDLGLINKGATSVLNITLFDPGYNLYDHPTDKRQMNELTVMATSALKGIQGGNIVGYRDYRGIEVIGVWQWIESLQLGITTEVDLQEALQSYKSSRTIIITLVLIGLITAFLLAALIVINSVKTTRLLTKAADELEQQVEDRTLALSAALEDLKSEQTVLQCLFDNIPDPIFCKDNNKRYIKGNHAFFTLFNRAPEQVIGATDEEISHAKDIQFFKDTDQEVLDTGKTLVFERHGNNEDLNSSVFETRKSVIPFPDGRAPGVIAISRDITEQRRTEQSLKQAMVEAEAANKAKSEFLARMSHEIRTPMNGVIGMLDLVMDTSLSIEQQQKLEVARSSAQSLLGIINDILDFSRVEADKLELEIIDFDLPRQIEDSARSLAIKAEAKGVELLMDVTAVKHHMVKGDPLRIRQVLTNLLNNAIKFTQKGQIHIKAFTQRDGNDLTFTCSIEDTGIGIAEDKLEHLFDSFTQVDSSTTRIYGGSGLGLAICKRLSLLMQGKVEVHSELGKGSTFTFSAKLGMSKLTLKHMPKLDIKGLKVLVVDDNPINLDILTSQLSSIDIRPICVNTADEALSILVDEKQAIDLLLTDMNMPHKDGLSLVEEIRHSQVLPELKIIMLSSMSFNNGRQALKKQGLDGCLLKPVATSDLINVINLVTSNIEDEQGIINEHTLLGFDEKDSPLRLSLPSYHHVLIVEDNPVNMMVAEGLMKKIGLRFSNAYHGQECLDTLNASELSGTYTMILMDCQMPILDGYDATKKIRAGEAGERYKHIPIIAMTANAMQGDKEKCISYGMNFHVPKPINNHHLVNVLSQAIKLVPEHLTAFEMPVAKPTDERHSMQNELVVPYHLLSTMDWKNSPPSLMIDPKSLLKSLSLFKQHISVRDYQYSDNEEALDIFKHDIHTLKGSAGNMGFETLHEQCIVMEEKLSTQSLAASDFVWLNKLIKQAFDDADIILEHNKHLIVTAVSTRPINSILAEILTYSKNSEMVPMTLVDELKSVKNKHEQKAEIETIIALLDNFDYETLTPLIAKGL